MEFVVYNRIKAVLAEHDVSNKGLAEAVGVSEQMVSNWCVQKNQPSMKHLYAIANYLKIDVRELLVPNEQSPRKEFKF
jgi:putative transcriptional regulator